MKNYTLYILLILLTSACCTKKDCINIFDVNEIKLINFDQSELEHIFIRAYSNDGSFSTLIDSSHTSTISDQGNQIILYSSIGLNPNNDYKIEFINLGLTYEITNITTQLEKCNSCFLTKDEYEVLSSYHLNTIQIESSMFQISK